MQTSSSLCSWPAAPPSSWCTPQEWRPDHCGSRRTHPRSHTTPDPDAGGEGETGGMVEGGTGGMVEGGMRGMVEEALEAQAGFRSWGSPLG